jgi:hypothetical protein
MKPKLQTVADTRLRVSEATGMLCTDNERQAHRALNFLLGYYGIRNIGWSYKEGYYEVWVLFLLDESHSGAIKETLDTQLGTDLKLNHVPLTAFQEVML